jgi:hypothetical protein
METLSDDVLLDIFRRYMETSPQLWSTLTHICRRWREIVLLSPLGLNLRLYCTYGTPVLKSLEYFPPFPLVVNYGGSPMLGPPAPEDQENIMAALKQSDRVVSISLTVTNWLLEGLSTISEPFSKLEELALLSRGDLQLTLPSAFRWDPRLRTLRLTSIAIPSLPQLLSHLKGLVDLRLHEIPHVGYFSPYAFANALSEMTQLETLSLHFLSLPPRRSFVSLPPQSGERVVLPYLTSFTYRGTSKYLDNLVSRTDAPRLEHIDIRYFLQPTMDASQLGRFIERIEVQTSLSQADIITSANNISLSFSKPGQEPEARPSLVLQISCEQLDWQLPSMAQICNQFSPFLSRVRDLRIDSTQSPSGRGDVDCEQWAELIRAFGGAVYCRAAGPHVTDILRSLSLAAGEPKFLPALRTLHVPELTPGHVALKEAAESFATSCRLSGHPVQVLPNLSGEPTCEACDIRFRRRQEFARHLRVVHGPANVCPHCGIFKWKRPYKFREHLKNAHPEVAHTNTPISNPASQALFPLNAGSHDSQHSDLRASDTVA